MASQRTIASVVTLLLAGSCQLGTSMKANAQNPESCEGSYSGSYGGSFVGDLIGGLFLENPGFCDSPNLGGMSLSILGELAQQFWMDPERSGLGTTLCVFQNLSVEGS
ncbi:MAG: hypothetical protein KC917_23180, partial [Candidatus Omnitrophica bacterium]|nr:hypothetical protein [Candidatus Omnitrophota bacterium]